MQPRFKTLVGLLLATSTALAIIGCKGSTGSNGAPGAAGPQGTSGTTGTSGASGGQTINVPALTAAEWSALSLTGTVTSVSVPTTGAITPTVNFKMVNANGVPVVGLGQNGPDGYSAHLAFTIAKLMPTIASPTWGTTLPSRWINYEFVKMPTAAVPAGSITATPDPESNGTLVDNGDGTYAYTFSLDLGKAASIASAVGATLVAPYNVADLGDLSYAASNQLRVVVLAGGVATSNPGALPVAQSSTFAYDFIPNGNKVGDTRTIVQVGACNACHTKLTLHANYMPPITDTVACVVCHTDQMKYGSTESYPTTGTTLKPGPNPAFAAFDAGNTTRIDGRAVPAFPNFVHKIHMGENLSMTGTDFLGTPFDTRYPQDVKNCANCHTQSAATPDGANWNTVPGALACGACHDADSFVSGLNHPGGAQSDDSKCGYCHTPTDIQTYHLPITPPDLTNGGAVTGGVASNTHTNPMYVSGNTANVPSTAIAITWKLLSAAVDASGHPSWTFQPYANGKATTIQTYNGTTVFEMFPNMVGTPTLEMVFAVPQDGIATPADYNSSVSVSMKAAWRGSKQSTYSGTTWTTGAALAGTTWTANANGSYTAYYAGATVPSNATLITAGIGYNYGVVAGTTWAGLSTATPVQAGSLTDSMPLVQTNLPAPYAFDAKHFQGGLALPAPNVMLPVSATSARRTIINNALCLECHQTLGLFTNPAVAKTFHSGQRNDGTQCVFCHNANGFDNSDGSFWSYNAKEIVHSLHAAGKRTVPFTWQAGDSMWQIGYPAILNNCEACHVSGSYDFSATANAAALPNLLWSTTGAGTVPATVALAQAGNSGANISPYAPLGTVYGTVTYNNTTLAAASKTWPSTATGTALNTGNVAVGAVLEADPTTLVTSPISAACFGCHDSAADMAHMTSNGGHLFTPRSSVVTATATVTGTAIATTVTSPITKSIEQCMVCHGTGAVADIKAVHMNF